MTTAIVQFAENFNVATSFIDLHVDEGRDDRVAINAAAGTVTYTDLARNVNRCDGSFRAMSLAQGDQV
ncbi:MAG: hypothetical protein OSB46_13965 [Alphaproteobacteria bacterium]|nr:hypothetical protein [Alphaproteobacteria bacterium]